jgi:Tfp pilus assembly protein PilF
MEQAFSFHQQGNLTRAMTLYQSILKKSPQQLNVLNNMGIIYQKLQRDEDALVYFERALQLEPNFPPALYNRGNSLRKLNRPAEAVQSYDRVLQAVPHNPEVLNNRGNALRALNKLDEAHASFAAAIRHAPDYADAHWNLGLSLLLAGDYQHGWQHYEWRWKSELKTEQRYFSQPLWTGQQTLTGKTILLHAEQGFGDTLQFCRYTSLVKALGAKVILEVQPQLAKLLADLQDVDVLMSRGDALPAFDFHCPLLSLPKAFNTELGAIPNRQAYLNADSKRSNIWRDRLGAHTSLRVGLVWAGSTGHKNDHNRSIPLQALTPLLKQNARFYSLQKELRDGDRQLINKHPQLEHLGKYIKDFTDTAALINLMDVVITVDTAVAHLAGAMGKKVWILLPYSPDWRWLLARDDNPWYQSARLFRQTAIGDWESVVSRVQQALQSL